jgi:hypothetical protein
MAAGRFGVIAPGSVFFIKEIRRKILKGLKTA